MDRRLLDYLPPVLREVLEFKAINEACEPEIRLAWDAVTLILDNQFLATATEAGVRVWEKELGIYPKDTDTLEVRKARIKAMWNLELPYTLPWLRRWLANLCGPRGHAVAVEDYTIHIRLDYTVLEEADRLATEILNMLFTVCPANMRIFMHALLQSQGRVAAGAAMAGSYMRVQADIQARGSIDFPQVTAETGIGAAMAGQYQRIETEVLINGVE